jgi:hypothetical protein
MSDMITRRGFSAWLGAGVGAGMIACAAPRSWAASALTGHHSLLVFSDPLPGQEEAFAQWHKTPPVTRMRAIPGIVAAQSYLPGALELRHTARKTPAHLTIYTIQSARFAAAAHALAQPGASGQFWPPESCASVQTLPIVRIAPPRPAQAANRKAPRPAGRSAASFWLSAMRSRGKRRPMTHGTIRCISPN